MQVNHRDRCKLRNYIAGIEKCSLSRSLVREARVLIYGEKIGA
jgi:hypothetical protein